MKLPQVISPAVRRPAVSAGLRLALVPARPPASSSVRQPERRAAHRGHPARAAARPDRAAAAGEGRGRQPARLNSQRAGRPPLRLSTCPWCSCTQAAAALHSPKAAATASPSESPSSPKSPMSPPPLPPHCQRVRRVSAARCSSRQPLPLPALSHLLSRPPPLHHANYATAPSALSLSLPVLRSRFCLDRGCVTCSCPPAPRPCPPPPRRRCRRLKLPGVRPREDWKQRLRAHLSGFFATRVSRVRTWS